MRLSAYSGYNSPVSIPIRPHPVGGFRVFLGVCMPIYEYACQACGHAFEAIQKFSDAALSECPVCGQPQLKKLISAGGFQLKGSGWYATDFKGGSKKSESSGGSDSGSGSGSGSDSGSGSGSGPSACGTKAGAGGCGGGCAG